jgi:hypothetical protein
LPECQDALLHANETKGRGFVKTLVYEDVTSARGGGCMTWLHDLGKTYLWDVFPRYPRRSRVTVGLTPDSFLVIVYKRPMAEIQCSDWLSIICG